MIRNELVGSYLLFITYFLTGCGATTNPSTNYPATYSTFPSDVLGTPTFILAILGTLAWTPYLIDKFFTKAKLKGRIISDFANIGIFANKPCLLHFMAFNLTSLRKPFNICDITIQIRYEDSEDVFIGHYSWFREVTNQWASPDNDNTRIRLHILPKDTLPYAGVIPEGEAKTVYLTFHVDKASLSRWKWLRIQFVDYSGHTQKLTIEASQIKPERMVWDDRIWEVISSKK